MGLWDKIINPLNAELNPICHLLALLGAHHILHVRGIRVNIRNVSDKSGRQKSKSTFYVMFKSLFSENRAVYEIMWNNMVRP